jgi:hypothetical protein
MHLAVIGYQGFTGNLGLHSLSTINAAQVLGIVSSMKMMSSKFHSDSGK